MDEYSKMASQFNSIQKLTKDMRNGVKNLRPEEIRYLVDSYYQIQEYRKRAVNQVKIMTKTGESNELIEWISKNMKDFENNIKKALDIVTDSHPVGQWSKSVVGIGPVISAGLLAHIDIQKAPTVGHIWRFAGLDPSIEWKRKQRRPWNAQLKRLCWIMGQSFVKVSNHPNALYGSLYKKRKEYEEQKNNLGEYANQAHDKLNRFKISTETTAFRWYSQGKLPPAHIDQRAQRWAVKLFLSHWHGIAYKYYFGMEPPKPYAIAQMGHAHFIQPLENVSEPNNKSEPCYKSDLI